MTIEFGGRPNPNSPSFVMPGLDPGICLTRREPLVLTQ
jgi:hypothetical protein